MTNHDAHSRPAKTLAPWIHTLRAELTDRRRWALIRRPFSEHRAAPVVVKSWSTARALAVAAAVTGWR